LHRLLYGTSLFLRRQRGPLRRRRI